MVTKTENESSAHACWICGSRDLRAHHRQRTRVSAAPVNFRITDSDYGVTFPLSRCGACGFVFAAEATNILSFYEALEDPEYESGRVERSEQMFRLLGGLARYKRGGTLLDVGAGTGMLVEQARKMGFAAEGIEPSSWLQAKAVAHGLPVHLGTLESFAPMRKFDVITLVDVIEHVTDPMALLQAARDRLADGGLVMIVTPDLDSLAARALREKWWHFRLAHVGYFNRRNLVEACRRKGLRPVSITRPRWYFRFDYLFARLRRYVPVWLPRWVLDRIGAWRIPLNLQDSLTAIVAATPS